MHYFQFNIGDYASHTRHLTLMEDLAYRRMLDTYYLREQPLPINADEVARLIGMRDHVAEVTQVLNDFFVQSDCGWRHDRADADITHFRDKSAKASNAGKASAQRRLNERSTDVQPTNNHKPITNNQEPDITPLNPPRGKYVVAVAGVDDDVWNDFQALRKAKKAPLTETALKAIEREAAKAGWTLNDAIAESVARGWQSFKADWVKEKSKANGKTDSMGRTERAALQALRDLGITPHSTPGTQSEGDGMSTPRGNGIAGHQSSPLLTFGDD